MSWNNNPSGPWGSERGGGSGGSGGPPRRPPEEAARVAVEKFQRWLRRVFPGGDKAGPAALGLAVVVVLAIWALSGFYRVLPDEQGVELRFGKFVASTPPGLHYHLPYPVESVITPKVTIINRVDVGSRIAPTSAFRSSSLGASLDAPEESLMLTGDENIVDIDFSVFWIIKDAGAYLFNIRDPAGAVKVVAESAMREVVGARELQPVLTQDRQSIEEQVRLLMQNTLDDYGAGITVTQVKMQKADPPAEVIDSFRDVQAARADQERARNEANAYANKIVPEARGEAARIARAAEAYEEQTISDAEGQGRRFAAILAEYTASPGVTRERMFLETMEKTLGTANKIIIDGDGGRGGGSGIVPYLPLNELIPQGITQGTRR